MQAHDEQDGLCPICNGPYPPQRLPDHVRREHTEHGVICKNCGMLEKDYRKQRVHKCQEKRQLPLKGIVTTAETSRVTVRVEGATTGSGPLQHEKVIKPSELTSQQMHPDIKPAAMEESIRVSPAFWAVIYHL